MIIRVRYLVKGARFIMLGIEYVVSSVSDRIYYRTTRNKAKNYRKYFGLNDNEKIELVYSNSTPYKYT